MSREACLESDILDYLQATHSVSADCSAETDLIEEGRLDSLLVMELVCFIESRFAVAIEPADIVPDNMRNVRCLAGLIAKKVTSRKAA